MINNFKDVTKIIVLSESNTIINVLNATPAKIEYVDEDGVKIERILKPITSIDQLRLSLPLEVLYVKLDKNFEQTDAGVLNLTHDNYNEFVSSEQVIDL